MLVISTFLWWIQRKGPCFGRRFCRVFLSCKLILNGKCGRETFIFGVTIGMILLLYVRVLRFLICRILNWKIVKLSWVGIWSYLLDWSVTKKPRILFCSWVGLKMGKMC
ncbi:hypothetical protein I3843_09G021200 [Carya illinoinensis]|nr:hypothetical protein I3843_09G021200 [Carya illinoinensis]